METQNALSSKREANEYQLRLARLQDELNILQRDHDHLITHNRTLERTVNLIEFSIQFKSFGFRSARKRFSVIVYKWKFKN